MPIPQSFVGLAENFSTVNVTDLGTAELILTIPAPGAGLRLVIRSIVIFNAGTGSESAFWQENGSDVFRDSGPSDGADQINSGEALYSCAANQSFGIRIALNALYTERRIMITASIQPVPS